MRKTWSIMRRDLLKLGRNPLTIFTSVLLPIIYLIIFGNSFQGVLKHLPVVIVSHDNGPYAIRVMEQMQALAAGPKTIAITYNSDAGDAIAGRARRRLQGRADHPARLQPRHRRGPHRRAGTVHRQRRYHQRGDADWRVQPGHRLDPRRLRHRARAQARSDRAAPEQPVHHRRLRPLADSGRDRDGAVHGLADFGRIQLGDGPLHGHHGMLPGDAAVALEPRRRRARLRACW